MTARKGRTVNVDVSSRPTRAQRWSWFVLRAILVAAVVVNGAIAITALVAVVLTRGDFVSPLLWRCGSTALMFGWILTLEVENRRLKGDLRAVAGLLRRRTYPTRTAA